MKITYSPRFLRRFKKLEEVLQTEAKEKIKLFGQDPSHQFLKTHKLNGRLNQYSFSINYKYRIVFTYISKDEVYFLTIGNHAIYL